MNNALDQIRIDYHRRYNRRLRWRRFKNAAYLTGVYLGTGISAALLAIAYIAAIAILCGY
jgi:hypothetical protein